MANRVSNSGRRTRARNLCRHFDSTELASCARPGLEVLEVGHRPIVLGGANIACGVHLDLCRKMREPNASRWDYVFVERDTDNGVAIEVHHTDSDLVDRMDVVDRMIEKKQWAEKLLAEQCPNVRVLGWFWLASPPESQIFILPQSPKARRLADAKIRFPQITITLP
jgi:hypothetical protein